MNLLFIAPIFFDYEKAIQSELEKRFDKVVFRCEVPFNSSLKYYALRRFLPRLAKRVLVHYNRSLVALLDREKIDKVFVVRGFGLLPEFLEAVQSRGLELINYQWDSLQNNPNGLVLSQYTNKNFSFDLKDCHQHPHFSHLSLFYTWKERPTSPQPAPTCDIFFVGSYHSARHLVVKELQRQCSEQGFVFSPYIYMPLTVFVRKKLAGEQVCRNEVKFRKLSRKDYFYALQQTQAMLDIQSPTQTGATMRTIETLSLYKKLISTNLMLTSEGFYSCENIWIWDGKTELNLNDILSTPFNRQSTKVLSLTGWIDKILR